MLVSMGLILVSITSTPSATVRNGEFVQIVNGTFSLDGKPYYVAGANSHYLSWGSTNEVDNVLNDAVAMHLNVIRTFMGPILGSLDETSVPTIWNSHSTNSSGALGTNGVYLLYWDTTGHHMAWNDGSNGLQRMDYVISKAQSLHLKMIIEFLDNWSYIGGAPQIAAWYESSDPSTFFFQDPRPRQNFKDLVWHLLNHVNSYTGVAYKNDPTILGWELMNEPGPSSDTLTETWITEMSKYVKSIDQNHLLSSGLDVFDGGTAAGSIWNTMLALPSIDFGVWHAYPLYHDVTPAAIVDHINQHCDITKTLHKPVLMEEFGYKSTSSIQSHVYDNWTTAVYNNRYCGGWLFWVLTSMQDNGLYPENAGEGFDIHNDHSASAIVLEDAAIKLESK